MTNTLGRSLLRAWLARPNVSGVELARRCGMTPSAICRLSNGDRREPKLAHAIALRDHAGIPIEAWCAPSEPRMQSVPAGNDDERTTEIEGGESRMSKGLRGKELEELNRAMGVTKQARAPYERLPDGRLRINSVRPSDWNDDARIRTARTPIGGT